MKTVRKVQYAMLFIVLFGFTAVSLGMISASSLNVSAADADTDMEASHIQVTDSLFDMKVLRFLKTEKVCALNEEQTAKVKEAFFTKPKEFNVDGKNIDVLYVQGNPLNKNIIEHVIGEKLDKQCQVVHGNFMVALISPMFVS